MNKTADKFIFPMLILMAAIFFYTLPLLLNIDRALTLDYRSMVNCLYDVYCDAYFYRDSMLKYFQLPLWVFHAEGGALLLSRLEDMTFSPFSLLILLFGYIKGLNLSWYLLYFAGALSMFYLTTKVLKYNSGAAMYSSIVFSMCGFFPIMQMNGAIFARETILLPLLTAFFIKAQYSNRYILFTALLLFLFCVQSGPYYLVIFVFLLMFTLLNSVRRENGGYVFNKRPLVVLAVSVSLSLLYALPKIILIFDWLGRDSLPENISYLEIMYKINRFRLFESFFETARHVNSAGYMGYFAPVLCVIASIVFFKKLKKWIFILIVFILLCYGPASLLDLNYILWQAPFFKYMREIIKYYAVIVVFMISLLSGYALHILKIRVFKNLKIFIYIAFIFITYIDLFVANSAYFNEFRAKIPCERAGNDFFQVKLINSYKDDEGGSAALKLALLSKNIGILNYAYSRMKEEFAPHIIPKYFLMHKFVFFAPSTQLLTARNPKYEGEVFFGSSENKALMRDVRRNAFIVYVDVKHKDRLIVNQNYSYWWVSSLGKIRNYNGFISLELDKLGKYSVRFDFVPINFYITLFLSVVALLLSLLILFC